MEFDRTNTGITLRFERDEASVLDRLLGEMELVLKADTSDDPVRERLFPSAYSEPEEQRSYEELVGDQLRDEKVRALHKVRARVAEGDVAVPTEEIDTWLVVITDLRLALGTRLNVTEDLMGDELDPGDPDAPAMAVLHWLGWVQESMLSGMPH